MLRPRSLLDFGHLARFAGGVLVRAQIPDMHAHCLPLPSGVRSPSPHAVVGMEQ